MSSICRSCRVIHHVYKCGLNFFILSPGSINATKSSFFLVQQNDKMLYFFENQILISLFQSIFLESELAKTAARMTSMYDAENNSQKSIRNLKINLSRARRNIQNIRILDNYAQTQTIISDTT